MAANNNHIFMLVGVTLLAMCSRYVAQRHEHFKLVQQWSPAFCKIKTCARIAHPLNFTIHGLWPDRNTPPFLNDCRPRNGAPQFMSINDPPLLRRLDVSWPDLLNPITYGTNRQTFWKEQWDKHGTCSWNFFTRQNVYFEKALILKDKFDLLDILRRNQIYAGSEVDVNRVTRIISQATGGHPIVKCTSYPDPQTRTRKVVQLTEIIICFDYNAVSAIPCPQNNKKYDYGCTTLKVDFPK